ncbi:uncharacterized protein LOC102308593 [Xyrichtys novacula]|uniref:Uncharacterized protein LOC102308593 n=1 Tax=Xyrichtys novacula TaxID=13765 RepID=A0AAV1HMF9_XYRNO|nr:uncharacterized protein LOC102308593 [Xyrichtys novacula]
MGLSLDHVSTFSADNANVNYGSHNSVFTKLREVNSEILRGNCHAHIVHNTLKKALDKLSVDNWVPLKSYLISIGEECPKHLKELLRLTEDAAGVKEEPDTVEVYLLFCNNVLSLFEEVVKKLEKNPLSLASGKISFDDMDIITHRLCLVGRLSMSMDDQYEECVTAKSLLEHLTQKKETWQSKGTAER